MSATAYRQTSPTPPLPKLRKMRDRVSCQRPAAKLSYIPTVSFPVFRGARSGKGRNSLGLKDLDGLISRDREAWRRPSLVGSGWMAPRPPDVSFSESRSVSEDRPGRHPALNLDHRVSCGNHHVGALRNAGRASPESVRSRCLAADFSPCRAPRVLGPLVRMILADAIDEVLKVSGLLGLATRNRQR